MKKFFFQGKFLVVLLALVCSASFTACSDDDDDKKDDNNSAALPVDLNFLDPNFPVENDKEYQPFEYKDVACWLVNMTDGNNVQGNYTPVLNLTKENTSPLHIYKTEAGKESELWNWTGGIALLGGNCILALDLNKFSNIKKISIRGIDNNSFIQAKAFDGTTLVAEMKKVAGNSSAYVDLTLDINGKKVTQLYIAGLESVIKRITIE